jgi:pre-mRNA-splicing factor 18
MILVKSAEFVSELTDHECIGFKQNDNQIMYHLRKLGQPAVIFGEDHQARIIRLKKAESEIDLEEELKREWIQENTLHEIKKEEKKHFETNFLLLQKDCKNRHFDTKTSKFDHHFIKNISSFKTSNATKVLTRTSEKIPEKLEENNFRTEDQCIKYIKKWCYYWKKSLLFRNKDVRESSRGRRAFEDYKTTIKAFQYLFGQLKSQSLPEDIKKGIWFVVQAMKERNYMHADAILLNAIAIGNAPWPIGVTQVGIHTKSAAREKISTTHLNKSAAAHIMGDEATRKYLHGLKRLLTCIQRLFPTDPSRCVEFDNERNNSEFTGDYGSKKLTLIEAE